MDARFRIRTRDGQELEPRTLEIFSELVRSGVVRPKDQVFDALTGEWAPAEAHPMVRLFQDPLLGDPLWDNLDARVAEGGAGETSVLGLSLTDEPAISPAEAAESFIRKMEEERRSDPQMVPLSLELPLTLARPREGTLPAGPLPRSAPQRPAKPLVVPFPLLAPERPEEPTRRARPSWIGGLWIALAGSVVGAWVLGPTGPGLPGGESAPGTLARAEVPARTLRGLPASEDRVRRDAYAGFLEAVVAAGDQTGVGEAPAEWLEGRYLADAASYPEVRRYWERAGAHAQTVQEREDVMYREAWLAAAEGLGVSGPVRSLRLATALEDFAAGAPARSERYRRVWELSTAALALHDLLVELGGRVTYQPMSGTRVSADPVLEASGSDPEAQALLEVALDRVLKALRGPDGSRMPDRSRLSTLLVEGLEEAAG
ncbi:MAG: hypothetical protein Q8N53_09530 [Longimicrobiales bacterium]|nr:hypothetical protein [Longimicrobiales bacterium]